MKQWERFFKIAKIDKEEQMVYGYASTPDLDSDGEVIKISALEKALPEYMKFPTLREMHQPKAVGTTKEATMKKKGLYIGAKVVNKESWDLVKEGVYRAFSIGGNVIKKVGNVIQELELVEISLVDVPANKAAIIEVWKRGKLSKDAETAYSMANLMIQVKDIIYWYEYKGKDTKKLKKLLETIKGLLAIEAAEPESVDNSGGETIYDGQTSVELEKKITILEATDLGNDPVAEILRKGVIMSMKVKAKKLKKAEEAATEESEETTTEEETSTEETETTDEESTEETETEQKGEIDQALQKINSLNKKIEKLAPTEEVEKQSKDLTKAVSSIAGSLAKVVDVMSSMEARIATLEKTPAAPKSRSAVVLKSETTEEETTTEEDKPTGALAVKLARKAELEKTFNEIGPLAFSKRGLSTEAARLLNEIDALKAAKA